MKKFILIAILFLFGINTFAQQYIRCGSAEYLKQQIAKDPNRAIRLKQIEQQMQTWIAAHPRLDEKFTITIPVVVHVVWNTSDQNISDAQVQSQIDVLNEDYNRNNADKSLTPPCFDSVAGRAPFTFCLASRDPVGNWTNGITRTFTTVTQFSDASIDNVKYDSTGGCSVWNPDYYLNIWVCNLGGGLLGLTQFPGGPPATDGPVILYSAFGRVGNLISVYNLGRTATHEVGHWLNLIHPWGDQCCCNGNDYCADTPPEGNATFNCPSGVVTDNCSGLPCGIMYQDFMDYTEDACMNMFTKDQVLRMMAALNGPRSLILSSNGCTAPTGISGISNLRNLNIFPNPANTQLTLEIEMSSPATATYSLYNVLGSMIYQCNTGLIQSGKFIINTETMPAGIYYLQIKEGEESLNRKVIVIH